MGYLENYRIFVPESRRSLHIAKYRNEQERLKGSFQVLDGNILMLVHPSSGDNIFYKVRDGNHIILIDSFGNEPQIEERKNYILRKER